MDVQEVDVQTKHIIYIQYEVSSRDSLYSEAVSCCCLCLGGE